MRLYLEVSEIGYLTWWNFPKKAWVIIIGEIGIITALSASLYSTYLNDTYFQTYANSLSPILVPVLSVAFGISSASIATYLYFGTKKIPISQESQMPTKNRVHQRKASKRSTHSSTSQERVADLPQTTPTKLRPIAPAQTHVQAQKAPTKEREDRASIAETKK